jgi:hypothetical protein
MNRLKTNISVSLIILTALFNTNGFAQDDKPLQIFNRGKLWHSMYLGKSGPSSFSNWRKIGIGLDWPGFDPTVIKENIGGSQSYMLTGGFWIGCKKDQDSVLAVEDWSIYASSIGLELTSKYRVTKHQKIENHWIQADKPNMGEEVIETSWEYNPNFQTEFDPERQLPIKVNRTSHQWNGSKRDENYIIHDYVIKNISDEIKLNYPERVVVDTLFDFYMLLNYALHCNSRSWSILFPTLTEGARNTWFFYNPTKKMISGQADDYKATVEADDGVFGFAPSQGPIINGTPTGEFLAPGFVGVRVLYASPNNAGLETRINMAGWSPGDNLQDLIGPMTGKGTPEAQYDVIANPSLAPNYVNSPLDTLYMRRSRMWSMMNLGPWTLAPGDSITLAIAEFVDGADYKFAINPDAFQTISQGLNIFNQTADKAKFTYDNNFNHPDPPAAPEFTVDFNREQKDVLGIVLKWGIETENIPDPDDGELDLTGYKIYRSDYLPIGPWTEIKNIVKGDASYFNASTSEYTFLDTSVTIGAPYYYALTAYDTGRTVWNINPDARFPETGNSNRVPPLESSIFANRTNTVFTATIPSFNNNDEVLVVPNPAIIGEESFSLNRDQLIVKFVNLPNPCTIRVYSIRGDLVKTLEVPEGNGAIIEWNLYTDYGQFIVSGIYIFHVESEYGNKIGKFAVVR